MSLKCFSVTWRGVQVGGWVGLCSCCSRMVGSRLREYDDYDDLFLISNESTVDLFAVTIVSTTELSFATVTDTETS